jgi:hypothetical protein
VAGKGKEGGRAILSALAVWRCWAAELYSNFAGRALLSYILYGTRSPPVYPPVYFAFACGYGWVGPILPERCTRLGVEGSTSISL